MMPSPTATIPSESCPYNVIRFTGRRFISHHNL
jgi:hypothetical protein